MKRTIQYFAIVTLLTLAASCNMIEETPSGSGLIGFSPRSVETKAMVNNADDLIGETFDVYDVLTANGTTSLHIDNSIAYNTSTYNWVYQEDPDSYLWVDGDHKFFGFTAGAGTLGTDWKVTVPEATLTTASTQTDILYSDIFSTAATAWKSSHAMADSVELHFNHLLSAVSFTMENCTGTGLSIQSVTVTLPNKASATVDFSGTTVAPAVTAPVANGSFGGITSTTPLANEAVIDVLDTSNDMTVAGAKASPFMIWPQTLAKDAATITLVFSNNRSRTVSIPADTQWDAGNIYAYHIKIYPDEIKLIFKVQPWEKESFNLDTKDDSINMSNVTWMNSKVKLTQNGDEVNTVYNKGEGGDVFDEYSVYMFYRPWVKNSETGVWSQYPAGTNNGYYPAQGYFTVNYPKSGVFKIGLIPAYGETTVDPSKYAIYIWDPSPTATDPNAGNWVSYDHVNGEEVTIARETVYFQVRAASGPDGNEYKAQINIWFKGNDTDAEWISAYSEIRANYALIIPAATN